MHASHFLSCVYFCSSVVSANGPVLIAEWENSIPFCPRSLYKIINLKFLLYVCKYHQTFRSSCSNSIPCGFLKSAESFWKESRACMHAILYAIVWVLQRMFSILDHLPLLQLSSMSLTGCFCLFFAPTVCFFFSIFGSLSWRNMEIPELLPSWSLLYLAYQEMSKLDMMFGSFQATVHINQCQDNEIMFMS